MDKTRIIAGLILIVISMLVYSAEIYDKPTNAYTTILFDACLLSTFSGSFIMAVGLTIKPPKPPKSLERCKCGKPGKHGFLKGDGKTGESYAECEECFTKNIRKLTVKYMKEAISKQKLDICPTCGLKGKRPSSKVKHYLRFYKCPNGHDWELKPFTKINKNETGQQKP